MNTTSSEQIEPEIVQAIIAKATARGMSVNDYLRQELGLTNGDQLSERPFYETATTEEWIIEFTKWADSHNPNTPALPIEAVSRESIYLKPPKSTPSIAEGLDGDEFGIVDASPTIN